MYTFLSFYACFLFAFVKGKNQKSEDNRKTKQKMEKAYLDTISVREGKPVKHHGKRISTANRRKTDVFYFVVKETSISLSNSKKSSLVGTWAGEIPPTTLSPPNQVIL